MQTHCRVCPVCKAGIEQDKVGGGKKLCLILPELLPVWQPSASLPASERYQNDVGVIANHAPLQVIPIYGRGGDNTDPRQRAQLPGTRKEDDQDGLVPRRPAGQRMAPVPVSSLHRHICLE